MSRFFLFFFVIILVMAGAVLAWWAFSLPGEVTVPVGQEIVAVRSGVAAMLIVLLGGLLALVWLLATLLAVRAARAGDFARHEVWALRSFALTFAAVTLRIYLGAFAAADDGDLATGQLRFDTVRDGVFHQRQQQRQRARCCRCST